MIECLAELVNADARLVERGRFVHTTFLLEVGETGYLVRIVDGRIVSVTRGPFVTPNYSFALRAPREAWESFWQPVPAPGSNDIFALFKRGLLRNIVRAAVQNAGLTASLGDRAILYYGGQQPHLPAPQPALPAGGEPVS